MSAIKAGDLVYVARDCCGKWYGHVFTVKAIGVAPRGSYCGACLWNFGSNAPQTVAFNQDARRDGDVYCMPVAWLRRLDPPAELEREQREETVPV